MTASIARPRWAWEDLPAFASAGLLVGASAGLGALAAWSTGSQHGPALGGLLVAAALGLELAKPAAVAGAIRAGWRRPIQAAGLAVLGIGAIAFSLSAELTLIAGARSDIVAERAGSSQKAADARVTRDRLAEELMALPLARASASIEAEVAAKVTSRADLAGCDARWLPSSKARGICIEVQQLRAELARAQRRESVASDLASAEAALRGLGAARTADPAAASLVTYAQTAGFQLDPGAVGQWLALVPVLALEIGSALAGLLLWRAPGLGLRHAGQSGGRLDAQRVRPLVQAPSTSQAGAAAATTADSPAASRQSPATAGPQPEAVDRTVRDQPKEVEARVRAAISAAGGTWAGSQRELASLAGAGRTAVGEALRRLADKRTVRLNTDPRGTAVELLA